MTDVKFHLILTALMFAGGMTFVVGDAAGSGILFWGGLSVGLVSLCIDIGIMGISLFK